MLGHACWSWTGRQWPTMEGWRALCSDNEDNGCSRMYVRGRGEQRAGGRERGGGGREVGAAEVLAGGRLGQLGEVERWRIAWPERPSQAGGRPGRCGPWKLPEIG